MTWEVGPWQVKTDVGQRLCGLGLTDLWSSLMCGALTGDRVRSMMPIFILFRLVLS